MQTLGPTLDPAGGEVCFVLEPDPRWTPVRVWYHLRHADADPSFRLQAGRWVARIPRPPVDRLEYLIVLRTADGVEAMVPDPGNPRRVPGVFGEKSLLEFPEYREPAWLARQDGQPLETAAALADIVDEAAQIVVSGTLHTPAGSSPLEPMPLLVVHDGPEYAQFSGLLRYLSVLARDDPVLRCRVLLLAPLYRVRSYSASPAYARALVTGMLPQVKTRVSTTDAPVGVGASLGALALAHAAAAHPGTFGGLFWQSGSFFTPETDPGERDFGYFDRVTRFVADLDASRLSSTSITMTCGTGEENLANNRAMARTLARAGSAPQFLEFRDGHNHTGWRDSLDPGLRDLLLRVWGI
jgi:enterochelin esterase-like enzyme